MRAESRLASSIGFLAALGVTTAIVAQPSPRACGGGAETAADWRSVGFVGLRLTLRLPPTLEQLPPNRLVRKAREAQALRIPRLRGPGVELAVAWTAPADAPGALREVLLYTVRADSVPPGRPCALRIAGSDAVAFRFSLSAGGQAAEDHWTEAYWPGFILAVNARSLAGADSALGLLRAITRTP
jgi:hypothetical protein